MKVVGASQYVMKKVLWNKESDPLNKKRLQWKDLENNILKKTCQIASYDIWFGKKVTYDCMETNKWKHESPYKLFRSANYKWLQLKHIWYIIENHKWKSGQSHISPSLKPFHKSKCLPNNPSFFPGKSLKITIDLHCFIPTIWVIEWPVFLPFGVWYETRTK